MPKRGIVFGVGKVGKPVTAAKTWQFQLILGEYESIIWHCGHNHTTQQEARECGRKNAPEVAERTVGSIEHKAG